MSHPPSLKERGVVLAGVGGALANAIALRLGLRKRFDGWRRAAGLVLRGENAMFVLSAFGLDVWSDGERPQSPTLEATEAHVALRLHGFLAREPASRISIERHALEHRAVACSCPSYTLAFAATAMGTARFVPPMDWHGEDRRDPPSRVHAPLLNIVCRVDHGGLADLWVRINHVGADGVPMQEMLTRLEAAWGSPTPTHYPAAATFEPVSRPCAGRPDLVEIQAFLDFTPLLEWRKRANANLPEPMTFAAALLWRMGSHPAFSGIHMGTTVEVAAKDHLARGVGVVVVRPVDYPQSPEGLTRYVREFNHQLDETRLRKSSACKTLDALAHVPPGAATGVLRHALHQGKAFGTLGLTILKDARVFGTPIGDVGHADGFIAIGSLSLPADDGGKVGCITIKGPAARVVDYPRILGELIRAESPVDGAAMS